MDSWTPPPENPVPYVYLLSRNCVLDNKSDAWWRCYRPSVLHNAGLSQHAPRTKQTRFSVPYRQIHTCGLEQAVERHRDYGSPRLSQCIASSKRPAYLYILPLSIVLVGAGACGERGGRLGSMALAEEVDVGVEYDTFRRGGTRSTPIDSGGGTACGRS